MAYNPNNPNGQTAGASSAPVVLANDIISPITQKPTTTGGLSVASGTIGATKTQISGSANQLYGWYFFNSNSSTAYCQLFNSASGTPTLGTTAPIMSLGIPAGGAANLEMGNGVPFSSGLTIAFTTTRSNATGPTNTVDYNIFYK